MKEKIVSALKTKYSNLGFSDKAFTGVAEYLSATVTEEDQIDNAIQGVETLLKAFQGDIDARVSSAVAKVKAEQNKGGDPQPKPKKEDTTGDDTPEWAKKLLEKVEKLESEKQFESLSSKFKKLASEKGVKNEKLIEKWMPKSEDELENSLNDLVEFNKNFLIEESNGKITGKPASSASSTERVSKEVQTKLDAWAKSKEPAVKE